MIGKTFLFTYGWGKIIDRESNEYGTIGYVVEGFDSKIVYVKPNELLEVLPDGWLPNLDDFFMIYLINEVRYAPKRNENKNVFYQIIAVGSPPIYGSEISESWLKKQKGYTEVYYKGRMMYGGTIFCDWFLKNRVL